MSLEKQQFVMQYERYHSFLQMENRQRKSHCKKLQKLLRKERVELDTLFSHVPAGARAPGPSGCGRAADRYADDGGDKTCPAAFSLM